MKIIFNGIMFCILINSSACFGMAENDRFVMIKQIILNGGELVSTASTPLSQDHIQTLTALVKDKKQYAHLCACAFDKRYPEINQILSNVFMRECGEKGLSQRVSFVLILPRTCLYWGVDELSIPRIVALDCDQNHVGYITWVPSSYGYHILKLFVEEGWRKQHIGAALMTLTLRYFSDRTKEGKEYTVTLTANSEDPLLPQEKLVEFYQRFGFKSDRMTMNLADTNSMTLRCSKRT